MSKRKEEQFDFDNDLDNELFSGADKKDSADDHDDLDFMDDDEPAQDSNSAAPKKEGEAEGEFDDIGGIESHAEQDFNKDMFDPASLSMEEGTHADDGKAEASTSQTGLPGLIQKVKEGWPYYLGAGVAVLFGIYLISNILSGTTSAQQTKAKQAASAQQSSSSGKALGLNLQDTTQFKGNLEQSQQRPDNFALSQAQITLPQEDASGSVTMSKEDMTKLLQGFSQAVNSSVEKISTGMGKGSVNEMDDTKQMRKAIEMLIERIDKYEQNLGRLESALSTLSTQLNLLVAQKTAQNDSLTLRAVIPGRAWLVDTQGRTYTVAEGDVVGNFGKVVQIDATVGRVMTSSGYVFN